ncbi:OCIA domain-containing protein 1 [Spea bombifrons]|uniref:OCIA domain-containing protein 1 n=1 Tax=Spea bombifrons TaxID=233779 RepID=UPI00234A009D|nr:OCIA domain-containing protein 1 [Spea bombifrons]
MAASPAELSGQQPPPQHSAVQAPGVGYVPTEDERRVFRECNEESFWYRSVPIATISMILTQGLVSRGILTASSRFGSAPKVAFAGFCGYLIGKVSYMKNCQEKFKRLENSPLGEALRQGYRPSTGPSGGRASEFSDDAFGKAPAPTGSAHPSEVPPRVRVRPSEYDSSQYDSSPATVPFSASLSESSTTGITDSIARGPEPFLEEIPKRKPMTYDELRNKNRETYEIAVTQRADTPAKLSSDRAPRKEVKTNKYGDVWEE